MQDPAQVAGAGPSLVRQVALLYLRLGLTSFGGPAVHIAMMEDEVVKRRRWLTREQFLDLLGAANLIPGPTSTEVGIYIGYRVAGWPGLVAAGACFIFPAATLTLLLAWFYVRYGSLPQVAGALYGIKAIIIAVVVRAIWSLGKTAVKTRLLLLIGLSALAAAIAGLNPLIVLFGAGVLSLLAHSRSLFNAGLLPFAAGAGLAAASSFSLMSLFLFFLKIGSVVFGSGYLLLVFLRADLVDRLHWLTNSQLIDALAAGQVTPGPVFSTATFIGYLLGGIKGAAVATIAVFLPSFVFVAISGPILWRIRNRPATRAFLDGLNAGALALMAVVTWYLGRAAVVDWPTAILLAVGSVLLVAFNVNPVWLVMLGGGVGYAVTAWLR